MAGKAVKHPKGYYIWQGGVATVKEMAAAPMYTVFPGQGRKTKLEEGPLDPDIGEPRWFPADVSGSDYHPSGETLGRMRGWGMEGGDFEIQHNDELNYDDQFKMKPDAIDDDDATVEGVQAGWTVMKTPTLGGEPGDPEPYRYYVIDAWKETKKNYWWESVRDQFGDLGAGPLDPRDLKTINRHRRMIGADPIDPKAGWTAAELADMADSIRRSGRDVNPTEAVKDRLLAYNPSSLHRR